MSSRKSAFLWLLVVATAISLIFAMLFNHFAASLALFRGIAALPSGSASFLPLRFTEKGTFQVTVFNDLHYGEGEVVGLFRNNV